MRMVARKALWVQALALALGGCVVGPRYQPPSPPPSAALPVQIQAPTATAASADGESQRFVEALDVPGRWWTLFHSPSLDAVVDQALKANPDVEAAQASLRQARENVIVAQAGYFPTVGLAAFATHARNPVVLASPVFSAANLYSLYNAQANVAYAPDVFGAVRHGVEGARAQSDVQRFQVEATYLALTANLVNACTQAAALKAQIAHTHAMIAEQQALLTALQRALAAGQAARGDVLTQAAAVAQAEASLPPLEKQAGVEHDLIQALSGGYPAEDRAGTIELADLTLPADLPRAVPARLVEQRPDIRAAEANLRAASAGVGVAMAARLPSVQISGALGGETGNLGELLSPGGVLWDIAAGAAQPVFEGGELLHRQKAAEAAYDQARAQYRSTVNVALQNVADSLRALDSDADALKIDTDAERAAAGSLAVAERQRRAGEVAVSVQLAAQVNYEQAAIALIQARAARYADTVALYQALGGGWWDRSDAS